MLLALEAAKQGDTLEARGSLQRSLDARPEVVRFLHVPEGDVTSVAFGPEGQIAAGYGVAAAAAAWCSSTPGASGSDPRRWRSRRARSERGLRAGGPDRRGIWRRPRRRRRRGALRRPWRAAPTRAAGGQGGLCQERGLRAGGQDRRGIWRRVGGGGGVVLFDARGERLRPAPLEVKEGYVTSVAFGPEGQIAAGYGGGARRRRRGALRRPWRAAPTRAAGGQGGRCQERGLRAGGQDRRGIWRAAAAAAWCSSTPGASGSDPAAGGQGGLCQ